MSKTTITGRAKLREHEESAQCDHCRREIRRLVYLSDGSTVGERCAMTALGHSRASIDAAPHIYSWEHVLTVGHPIRGALEVQVTHGGAVRTARRTYDRTNNTFSAWTLSEAA